jgi:hypothetical protein
VRGHKDGFHLTVVRFRSLKGLLEPGFVVYGDGDLVIEQLGTALHWTRSRLTTGSDGGCFRCRALSPARPTLNLFPCPRVLKLFSLALTFIGALRAWPVNS